MITGFGDPEGAETAIKNGAWDYIQKPVTTAEMSRKLNRAMSYRSERHRGPASPDFDSSDIVGQSQAMLECLGQAARASSYQSGVLITGETGTGKELFAKAICRNSARAQRSFVVVDCASLPETLVEGLLFGHEKGSFTGAGERKAGLIAQADKGTLFLDEVGELALGLQKPFLRALQEKRFRTIGGNREVESDFRLIAATNRDLEGMVAKGTFREDLFFRLRSFVIDLPPLRKRNGDLELLARYYADKFCRLNGKAPKTLSPELLGTLAEHQWPGNVRELANVIEMALTAAGDAECLYPHHLPVFFRVKQIRDRLKERFNPSLAKTGPGPETAKSTSNISSYNVFRRTVLAEAERDYFRKVMIIAEGDVSRACHISGLGRSQLYAKLKASGITKTRTP